MKKTLRIIFLVVLAFIIGIAIFVYTSFTGLPWKKTQTANELETILEEKYGTDVEVLESYYNFKSGGYGAKFKGKHGETDFTFFAEKTSGYIYEYYIEGLWEWQLRGDTEAILEEYQDRLDIDFYDYIYNYGIAEELKIDPVNIPHYSEVDSQLEIIMHLKDEWNEESRDRDIGEVYSFINELKENGIENIGLMVNSKMEKGKPTYYISIPPGEFNKIQSPSDLEKYLDKF